MNKPCPFCGSQPYHKYNNDEYVGAFCPGVSCPIQHDVMALSEWNDRVEPEAAREWVPVDGADKAPVGDWLFLLEDGKQHTGNVHKNITILGGLFVFDQPKAVAYMPLPSTEGQALENEHD